MEVDRTTWLVPEVANDYKWLDLKSLSRIIESLFSSKKYLQSGRNDIRFIRKGHDAVLGKTKLWNKTSKKEILRDWFSLNLDVTWFFCEQIYSQETWSHSIFETSEDCFYDPNFQLQFANQGDHNHHRIMTSNEPAFCRVCKCIELISTLFTFSCSCPFLLPVSLLSFYLCR